MEIAWTPYALPPLIAGLLVIGIALNIMRYHVTTAGAYMVGLMGSIAFWTLPTVADHLISDFSAKIALNYLMYLGIATVAPLAVSAALHISGRSRMATRRNLGCMWIVPAIFLGLAWTNELHHLVWTSRRVSFDGPFPALVSTYGPAFWAHVTYVYTLLGLAGLLLLTHFMRDWRRYRREAPLILGAIAIPSIANALYLLGLSPIPNADITSYALAITAVLGAAALQKEGALDISRIAPSAVLDEMRDGVMVTDAHTRVVYLNRRAQEILGLDAPALPADVDQLVPADSTISVLLRREGDSNGVMVQGETSYELAVTVHSDAQASTPARVVTIQDVTQRRAAEARITQLAYFDPLTDLPNRAHFHQLLEKGLQRAERGGHRLALLFLDLDRFKQINDTLGHGAGDELLRNVARRLECVVSQEVFAHAAPDAVVARLGGDEFTILLPSIADAAAAASMAERALETLAHPTRVSGREVFSFASIGIAIYPEDGDTRERLLLSADAAMYEAKAAGRNAFRYYHGDSSHSSSRRLELEGRLHHALERREISLAYQPVRDTESGEVESVEALLRWNDPKWGSISPEEFIPIAEETGLITALGEWTMSEACRQLRAWCEEGLSPPRLMINLSSHHLRRPGLVDAVRNALAAYEIPAHWIELEITESTIMHEDTTTIDSLLALEELDIRLALDDFGTGYSSLTNLRRFPFSRLKIDRSFVAGLPDSSDDVAIVEAVLAMAKSLRLDVVAEGVETEAQAQFLSERGCAALQGFLIAEPMSAAHFARFLSEDAKQRPNADSPTTDAATA